jgi:rhomboid family GlyGly-CTERM serine protease
MSDANRTHGFGIYGWTGSRSKGIWGIGLIVCAIVLLALGGEVVRSALQYERSTVLDAGEYWRLATAHFVHGSLLHAMLNSAGLLLMAALFPRHYSPGAWIIVGISSVVAIDAGFVWNEPQLEWYVGLSGVLHGVLAAGAIAWWRNESKVLALALSLVVIGKLAWEQLAGALPLSGDMPVIVDAHLYGAVGGAVAALILQVFAERWPRIVRPL